MGSGHRESTPATCVFRIHPPKPNVDNRVKQYKSKLKEWVIEKNIKEKDMRAIVRKDLKRKAEDPSRATTFRLRKRQVPAEKIERYRRDHGSVEETLMSDAGTLTSNTCSLISLNNLMNVATPSNISCETPLSVDVDDHESPSQGEHQALESQAAQVQTPDPPHAPDPACNALTAVAVNITQDTSLRIPTPRAPASTLESDVQALGLNTARGSMPSEDDANHPFDQKRYSTYLDLLQPLRDQLRKHDLLVLLFGPNDSLAGFDRHGFMDYIQHLADVYRNFDLPLILTKISSYALFSWPSWLVSRLEVVYTSTSTGGEGLRSYAGRDGLVPLFAQVDSFMDGFNIENPKVRSCIGRSGLWLFFQKGRIFTFDRYRAGLARENCSCFICMKLPKLLNFYYRIEAFQLYAVAEAFGYTVDHAWLEVFAERTRFLPECYSWIRHIQSISRRGIY